MLYGNPCGLIERAYKFAASAHAAVGQRRKYTGEPYITRSPKKPVSDGVEAEGGTRSVPSI